MADRKWFYWKKRSTEGFMAVLDTNAPGKTTMSRGPKLLRAAVELEESQLNWSLEDCMLNWPEVPVPKRS